MVLYVTAAENLIVLGGQQSVKEQLWFFGCEKERLSCPAQFQELFPELNEVVA